MVNNLIQRFHKATAKARCAESTENYNNQTDSILILHSYLFTYAIFESVELLFLQ